MNWEIPVVTAADIKKDIPNFPDEVIAMWLLPLANQPTTGWPPPNPFGSSRWKWILGEKDLEWWKKVDWKLEETDCSFSKLARGTQNTIQKMLAAHIDGEDNAYGEDPEKFFRQLKHILKQGKFSKPIAVIPVKSGLSVIDGNNRIASHACAVSESLPAEFIQEIGGQLPSKVQQVWWGTHHDGETLSE
jgi:hypothetical protein